MSSSIEQLTFVEAVLEAGLEAGSPDAVKLGMALVKFTELAGSVERPNHIHLYEVIKVGEVRERPTVHGDVPPMLQAGE